MKSIIKSITIKKDKLCTWLGQGEIEFPNAPVLMKSFPTAPNLLANSTSLQEDLSVAMGIHQRTLE